jgi:hypothetical protein
MNWIYVKEKGMPTQTGHYLISFTGIDWSTAFWNGRTWLPGPGLDSRQYKLSPRYWMHVISPNELSGLIRKGAIT